jgi:opacity protein-like surface antigen
MISIFTCANVFSQKGLNVSITLQPGASFIMGDWKLPPMDGEEMTFEKSFTFGFEGGVNGGYNFTDNLGVSVGMLYSLQGQKYKDLVVTDDYGSITLNHDINLSYLKIPMRFNFNTDPQQSISFTGYAGFYLGFLTRYKQTYKIGEGTDSYSDIDMTLVRKGKTQTQTDGSNSEQYDLVEKPFKSTNFGMTIGGGVQKKLAEKLYLQFMINYQLGFGDIKNLQSTIIDADGDTEKVYDNDDPNRLIKHKNSLIGLTIGLKKCF